MNKRILYFNFLSVFIALLLMSIISFFTIYNNNILKSKQQIENYLSVMVTLYEENPAYEHDPSLLKTYAHALDDTLRLTLLDSDGNVLYDSDFDTTEPHGNREEFLTQNTVFIRYSSTLQKRMMYIASKPENNDVVIRLALPLREINRSNLFFLLILLQVLIIYLIVVGLSILYYRRALKPFTKSLNELAKLAGSPKNYALDDPKLLSLQVNEIKDTINKQLSMIDGERDKLRTILDVMKTGVLVMDGNSLIHANKMVIKYFNLESKKSLELFINVHLKDKIQKGVSHSFIESINQQDYLFEAAPYTSTWLTEGLIISVVDITEEIKLEKTKKEFFQNASHELKSPLTVIRGNLELITEGIIKDNIHDTLLKTIDKIDGMNELINQMLDVSILESREIAKPDRHLIKDIINAVLTNYESVLLEKSIHVNTSLDDSSAFIEEKHLKMIITNLIDNAIKYNKKHGLLEITLHNQKLSIKDTGIGIDKQEINRIYERFYRSNNEDIKRISGSGLGLAIVKHIAMIYRIEIHLQSELYQGTTFTLLFPK